MCKPEDVALSKLQEMGFSEDDETFKEILNGNWVVWISEVDIDNDGINEIRFFFTVGLLIARPAIFSNEILPGNSITCRKKVTRC